MTTMIGDHLGLLADRERMASWASSLIAAAATWVILLWLGAPGWAAFGLADVCFAVWRLDDRVAGKR